MSDIESSENFIRPSEILSKGLPKFSPSVLILSVVKTNPSIKPCKIGPSLDLKYLRLYCMSDIESSENLANANEISERGLARFSEISFILFGSITIVPR